jgi:hypothetical protein
LPTAGIDWAPFYLYRLEAQACSSKRFLQTRGNRFSLISRILSRDGKELEALTSDENGLVRFQDYEPDEYLIKVEGFKIQEVRRVTE